LASGRLVVRGSAEAWTKLAGPKFVPKITMMEPCEMLLLAIGLPLESLGAAA